MEGAQGPPDGWTGVKAGEDVWDLGPNDRAKFGVHRSSGLGGVLYEKFGGNKKKN